MLNDFGFEVKIGVNELISSDGELEGADSYGSNFINKDSKLEQKEQGSLHGISSKAKIDLHTENLNHDLTGFSNQQIIELQIIYLENSLNNYIKQNKQEIIVVHGIGSGVLKEKTHELLKEYNLRFFLSVDEGSTRVFL